MGSLRAALLLAPPLSVVVALVARCVCRVMARKLSALAHSQLASFRYLVLVVDKHKHGGCGGGGELPVALYQHRREEEEEEECVLCLSGIEEGSEVRELRCRHLFHRACLDRWLRARPVATWPLCRGRLLPPPDSDSDSDMMLFMACVHSRSSWLWPSWSHRNRHGASW